MSIDDREHTAGHINSIFNEVYVLILNAILEKIRSCGGYDKYNMGSIRKPGFQSSMVSVSNTLNMLEVQLILGWCRCEGKSECYRIQKLFPGKKYFSL